MFRHVLAGLLLASGFGSGQEAKDIPKAIPVLAASSDAAALALAEAGRLYFQGQFDAAIQKYRQIIGDKPTHPQLTLA